MKNLILILTLILFSSIALFCCILGEKKENALSHAILTHKLTVGVKCDSKPFGFIDENGEFAGFDVDVAKAVSYRLLNDENAVEFVCVTPNSRISDLNAKKVDMLIAAMSITQSRAAVVRFSTPYYQAGQAIMVKDNSKIYSINDLNGANVGIVLGTTGEKSIRKLAPQANLRAAKTYIEIFELLKNGEIDAIFADDSMLYGILSDNKGYKILPKRYTKEYYSIALRLSEGSDELERAVNETLALMQEKGILNKIKSKWIPNLHS